MYVLKFRQSASSDVVKNRIRIRPANSPAERDQPYDDVPAPAADPDGYTRIVLDDLPQAQGLEGRYDVHVTAVDAAGNESPFLEVDDVAFDFVPPEAPTDGTVEHVGA